VPSVALVQMAHECGDLAVTQRDEAGIPALMEKRDK
jgi:hypothetical protein